MKVKNGKIRCLFCDSPIKFQDGQLSRYKSHIEQEHEVTLKIDLVLAISFLSDHEVEVLTNKLKPRLDNFIENNGEISENRPDIFFEGEIQQMQENQSTFLDTIGDKTLLGRDDCISIEHKQDDKNTSDEVSENVLNIMEDSLNEKKKTEESNITLLRLKIKEDNAEELLMKEEKDQSPRKDQSHKKDQIPKKDQSHNVSYNLRRRKQGKVESKETASLKPTKTEIKKEIEIYTIDEQEASGLDETLDESCDIDPQNMDEYLSLEMDIKENIISEHQEVDPSTIGINLVDKIGPNQCKLCFSEFSDQYNLKRHERNVHKDDQDALNLKFFSLKDLIFSCDMCPQLFLTENILITHKNLKHKVKVRSSTAKCDVCEKVVKFHSLKAHMQTHTGEKYECQLCYKKYNLVEYLKRHQKKWHSDEGEFINKKLTDEDLKFNCDLCNIKFVTVNVLEYHKRDHHERLHVNMKEVKVRSTTVKCDVCQKIVKYNSFKAHSEIHAGDKYECNLCYKMFPVVKYLNNHQKRWHTNEAEFINKNLTDEDLKFNCDDCNMKFVTANVLEYHKKVHDENIYVSLRQPSFDEKDKKYKCKLCYSAFKDFSNLHSHIMKNHEEDKELLKAKIDEEDLKHPCNECEYKFVSNAVLEYHKRRMHVARNKFVKCKTCSKVIRKDKFNNHKRSHGDKVHECLLCYAKFKLPEHLKKHQGKMHISEIEQEFLVNGIGEFQLECDNCYVKFLTEKGLADHYKKHVMELFKNFNCQYCPTIFFSQDVYRKHVTEVHKKTVPTDLSERKYGCKLCYNRFQRNRNLHEHIEKIHPDDLDKMDTPIRKEDLKFECNICEQKFISETILNYHENSHKKIQSENYEFLRIEAFLPTEKKYNCKLCYTKYKYFSNFIVHVKRIHQDETELLLKETDEKEMVFNCNECDSKFVCQTSLDFHNTKCHDLVTASNHCKLCDVTFKTRGGFTQHRFKIHKLEMDAFKKEYEEEDKIFDCSSCDKKYVTEISLNHHITKHHNKLKNNISRKKNNISKKKKSIKKFRGKIESQEKYCQLCYISYKLPQNLKKHKKLIHADEMEAFEKELGQEDMQHQCTKCSKSFYSKNTLEHHMQRKHQKHSKISEFSCKLCYNIYARKDTLLNHMKTLHENYMHLIEVDLDESSLKYSCQTCDRRFLTQDILEYHIQKKHTQTKPKKLRRKADQEKYCKLCYITYKDPRFLKKHKRNIHGNELDAFDKEISKEEMTELCTKCNKSFYSQNTLKHHIQRKHRPGRTHAEFSCKLCYSSYKRNDYLKRHIVTLHKEDMDLINVDLEESSLEHACPVCNRRFVKEHILAYHQQKQHKKQQSVNCKLCYLTFKFPSEMRKHKKKIHQEDLWAFEVELDSSRLQHVCSHCDQKFLTENILKNHTNRKHREVQETEAYCKLCYITFKYPYKFKEHKNKIHQEDLWAFQVELDESRLEHDCPHCDHRFISENILNSHITNQHKELKEKVSYCNLCYVDFKFNSNLKAHKSKIHTSQEEMEAFSVKMEKSSLQFSCKFCSKKFLTKNIQKYHLIHNHKEERRQDLSCEFCNKVFPFKDSRKKVMQNHMRSVHSLEGFDVDEHEPVSKENDTVKSFLNILNSLK